MANIGTVLYNPTNEDLDMQYAGISLTLKPGQQEMFNNKCANHLLNSFGQRGLSALFYGCDEEKVKADGVKRNTEFKKRMVVNYNQTNENRKHQNLGYHPPTEQIQKYAIELGLKLFEPYSIRDAEREAISHTAVENEKLKNEVAELKEMVKQLLVQKAEPEPKSELRVRKGGKWVKDGAAA
jgi:hypothetical protein